MHVLLSATHNYVLRYNYVHNYVCDHDVQVLERYKLKLEIKNQCSTDSIFKPT